MNKHRPNSFLLTLLVLQFAAIGTTLFDVPFARQIIGFVYLTFIPGFLILYLFRLNELDGLQKLLLSVGLSIAFSMLAGFLLNLLGFLFSIPRPLSMLPLIVVLNGLSLALGIVIYLRGDHIRLWSDDGVRSLVKNPFTWLFTCLPILSIVGTTLVNSSGSNFVLLLMILGVSMLFSIGAISRKIFPSNLYPFAILMIAIAVLFSSSLFSNYIVTFGSDIPIEYYLFGVTKSNGYWSPTIPAFWDAGLGRVNSMLSVTILPTIYSTLLNVNPTWIFKMLFPLIFAFVPLGLYSVWQTYIGKKGAFIAAFLFMAQATFYSEMLALDRQMIGEVFFVLLLVVIVSDKIKSTSKFALFTILSFALIVSHYALAEIFLFFIFVTLIYMLVLRKPDKKISLAMVVLFFVIMFAWYVFTSNSAVFDSFLGYGQNVANQLGDFFNVNSRGQVVLRGLGLETAPSIWNTASRVFAYVTEALIAVGFVGSFIGFTKIQVKKELFVLNLTAMAFLVALILVPGLASTLNITRFYHILLIFLAPFCVLGAAVIVKLLVKRESQVLVSIILVAVLVVYFLFQTGFIYEISKNDTYSFQLSAYRMDPLRLYSSSGYIDTYSVYGAQWLSRSIDNVNAQLYADSISPSILSTYGLIFGGSISLLSNTTTVPANGIIYLNRLNVVYGTMMFEDRNWNWSDFSMNNELSIVYTNGGSEVCTGAP